MGISQWDQALWSQLQQISQAADRIAENTNRIANCLEAAEKRARQEEEFTPEEMEALGPAIQAVRRGFADLEQAQREQREQ